MTNSCQLENFPDSPSLLAAKLKTIVIVFSLVKVYKNQLATYILNTEDQNYSFHLCSLNQ